MEEFEDFREEWWFSCYRGGGQNNTNLFLGTSKHVFKLWDKQGIIGKKLLEKCIEVLA